MCRLKASCPFSGKVGIPTPRKRNNIALHTRNLIIHMPRKLAIKPRKERKIDSMLKFAPAHAAHCGQYSYALLSDSSPERVCTEQWVYSAGPSMHEGVVVHVFSGEECEPIARKPEFNTMPQAHSVLRKQRFCTAIAMIASSQRETCIGQLPHFRVAS